MKKKTLKDILSIYDEIAGENGYSDKDLLDMVKAWIKEVEKDVSHPATEYPRGVFQGEILRKIFNLEDWDWRMK